jgi:5-methylcytosine-specific restriction protein A
MAKIAADDFSAAYDAGKRWISGELSERQAVDSLVTGRGMNRASASDYVRNLRQMIKGEPFHRTLNTAGLQYYLDSIRVDFDEGAYRNALRSLAKHLDYYEELPTGGKQPGLRQLLAQREASLEPRVAEIYTNELETQVREALKRTPAERDERLASASRKPFASIALVKLFKRNPDVIAEVLLRANGTCEECRERAPFTRKSDGSP